MKTSSYDERRYSLYITDRRLVSGIHEVLQQINKENIHNPKMNKRFKKAFHRRLPK